MGLADEFIPTLTHATERDIDLLLVEEIYSSSAFVQWLADKVGMGVVSKSTVLHSKRRTRSRREIDIFVDLTFVGGTRGALLIENKLDATEQPDQAESYREELAVLAQSHPTCAMLMLCPRSYQAAHPAFTGKFDGVVHYEDISAHFAARAGAAGDSALRMKFRSDMLTQAVEKHRRGYTPVPTRIIGDFNAAYVDLLSVVAPAILPGPSMLKTANPDESVSIIFDHSRSLAELDPTVRPTRFAHELGRGQTHRANYVAVTFGGWGVALKNVQDDFEADAAEIGATFSAKPPTKVRPRPGLVMACATEPVDNQSSFEDQHDQVVAGMKRALQLREWLVENETLLFEWRKKVEAAGGDT